MTLQLATAAVNELRSNHWVLNPVSGLYERSTLLELQSTNLVTRNSGFAAGVGPWGVTNQPGGAGVLTAVNDAAALAAAGLDKVVTDGIVLKLDNSAGTGVTDAVIPVTTAASAASMVAWVRGGSGGINHGGTLGATLFAASATYQRVVTRNFIAFGGASSMRVRADAGQIVFAVLQQLEQLPVETSAILTTSATATRSADAASVALPAGLVTPQAMTGYAKFIELGTSTIANSGRVFGIESAASLSTHVRLLAYSGSPSGRYTAGHYNGTGSFVVAQQPAVLPAIGDLVELRLVLNADGSVLLGQSVNGGAETVAGPSAALALAGAWTDPTLRLFQSGAGALFSLKLARGVKSMAQMRAF